MESESVPHPVNPISQVCQTQNVRGIAQGILQSHIRTLENVEWRRGEVCDGTGRTPEPVILHRPSAIAGPTGKAVVTAADGGYIGVAACDTSGKRNQGTNDVGIERTRVECQAISIIITGLIGFRLLYPTAAAVLGIGGLAREAAEKEKAENGLRDSFRNELGNLLWSR